MESFTLELYTRPTCSDCQDGKAFLKKHRIPYKDIDLTKYPEEEKKLITLSGARIVPAFVFKENSLIGKWKKPKVFIGFERNYDEITTLLGIQDQMN